VHSSGPAGIPWRRSPACACGLSSTDYRRCAGGSPAAMLAASARPRLSCACVMQARGPCDASRRRAKIAPRASERPADQPRSQPPNDLPGQGGPLSTCQPPWQHLGARNQGRRCRLTTALLIPATASGPCCCSEPAHGFRKHAVSAMGGLFKASEHGRTVARSTGTGRLLAVLGSCRSGGHEGRRRP